MSEGFFVVSIDAVMPRIIFQDAREDECQAHAEYHWLEVAGPEEMVFVVGAHDPQVAIAQRVPSC